MDDQVEIYVFAKGSDYAVMTIGPFSRTEADGIVREWFEEGFIHQSDKDGSYTIWPMASIEYINVTAVRR